MLSESDQSASQDGIIYVSFKIATIILMINIFLRTVLIAHQFGDDFLKNVYIQGIATVYLYSAYNCYLNLGLLKTFQYKSLFTMA